MSVAWLAACSGNSDSAGGVTPGTTVQPELVSAQYGRLVDVYGLRVTQEGSAIALFQRDVLIGANIDDERGTNEIKRDDEILYDFIGADPDSLQPRLFIPRDMSGTAFSDAFAALDDQLRDIAPMRYGTNQPGLPFAVVPRNAAIRLNFSAPLGVDDSFFVQRNAQGQITGLRNTEAVQLLSITGDPEEQGGTEPLATRVIPRDNKLILDPVLLGTEGLQYQTQNNARGLPESPDQVGANIRIALALEGPLAIPSLRSRIGLTGLNNSGRNSIIRDFRSGNRADESADLSNGFVRDPLPLRVVGEIVMYLERVERINAFTQEITVYKNGVSHEIDRGDVFRIIPDSTGIPFGASEVVVEPVDDAQAPGVQHVRVRIRNIPDLSDLDPRNLPGYPSSLSEREPWLVANAPRAVCVCEFAAGDGGVTSGDDPRNFLTFTPEPLPNLDGTPSPANENVSPFAGAVVRFTKPVAIETVKWADTFFFAMRDLTNQASIQEFIDSRTNRNGGTGMEPSTFNDAKYRTPYLIGARVFDEDSSGTALRLQPSTGFYLDNTMRNPPAGADYRYYLHLIANSTEGGIRDLAGNPIDLQGADVERSSSVVIPFTVDTRANGPTPFFEDNLAVSVVRRFASRDEDANPSYFLPEEVPEPGNTGYTLAYPLEDMFGGFIYVDGRLQARPTSRSRQVADNLNQAPVSPQESILRWCPERVGSELQVASNSSTTLFGQGIQNPLNPYGCRLQTLWREVDLSLSRTDPFDFNLDVEQMYWAPFTGTVLVFDEFDRVSLFLGHSEHRPAPCVGDFSSLPSLPDSGLETQFQQNFLWNPEPTGTGRTIESQPTPHPAYVDTPMTIDPATVVYEVNNVNRFLPLPTFEKPYFVYRDETVVEQGLNIRAGQDVGAGSIVTPYIVSPYNNGIGRRWLYDQNANPGEETIYANSFWNDLPNRQLDSPNQTDNYTGGLTGAVALPLLADFWTYCDSSELPQGNGYVALGTNGWQVSLTVQSSPTPHFRALSSGRAALQNGSPPICVAPGESRWNNAQGGYTPAGGGTAARDNTFYWIMIDMLKRQSVITNGFVDLNNPHRVPEGFVDPRLGPFYLANGQSTRPGNVVPSFAFEFDPPLSDLPGGTSIVAQFRAAGVVDPDPWYYDAWAAQSSPLYGADFNSVRGQMKPDATNFPLDPYIAGDAQIRKWDARNNRDWWTYFYNKHVTTYVDDPNTLVDPGYTIQFAGPGESFTPRDVRYVNWRFVTSNNVDASPPVAPTIETFALTWRFQRQ
ncbi:MAG: hypothetical protein NXI31_21280 [bacterium]|nr:hypothetical protein [bacterium]